VLKVTHLRAKENLQMNKTIIAFAVALLLAPLTALHAADAPQASKPNILVILADDMGFSDLGCYGSEIETPNLDRLAAGGLRFTEFYNTAKCHSSRISLMTGSYAFQAGNTALTRAVTAAEVLSRNGYFTAMTGKWHLDLQPTDFGFQRYFGHLSGACNYYRGDATFRLNGQPWTVPAQGFYTTVANVDFALKFLEDARLTKKPWFLYIAFNAPHAPLQPLEKDYKKYLGRYDSGWDVIRAARVNKQAQLGLFGKPIQPCPRPDHIAAWDSLSAEQRLWESRRMAAYGGLIDRIDQELGRLFADLKRAGEFDNTLILFFSDNGACPFDRRQRDEDKEPYHPDTLWSDSTGWAWVRNSPFRFYKQNQFEGGIATPGIVHWPAGLKTKPGAVDATPSHLVDVLPTLAELTGAIMPLNWPGRDVVPVSGVSLAPVLAGGLLGPRPPIHLLFGKDRGLRDGDWKLVSFQSNPWELYNMAEDRTELHNLAAQQPEIRDRLVKVWHDMAEKVLQAPAKSRVPVATTVQPYVNPQWTDFTAEPGKVKGKASRKAAKAANAATPLPRARFGTKLTVENNQLVLTCTGNDPGIAFNHVDVSAVGPYTLTFRLQSHASGGGELFWTTDPETILPKGRHQTFPVTHDGQWHDMTLTVAEPNVLYGMRLDPCAGKGEVRIESLQLRDASGTTLKSWP
jgi:arylsulfatase